MIEQTRTRMTAAEFFDLPEANTSTELLEGELIVRPSPAMLHQRTSRQLVAFLLNAIPNGEVFYAPMDVYFDEENVPQPDIV